MNNNSLTTSSISFDQLLDKFISYSKSNNKREETIKIYLTVKKHFIAIIGDKIISEYSPEDLENYKLYRSGKVKNPTINKEIRSIKAVFNYAEIMEMILKNPFKKIKQLKLDQVEILSMNDTEISILFEIIPEGFFKYLVKVALLTGCRLSEILYLQWKDIDLGLNRIYVKNKPEFKTKTGKNREIPINETLKEVIKIIKFLNHNCECADSYLFQNKNGKPYSKNYISRTFKKYIKKSNLDNKFHFHCLRHTFLTNLANVGTPINSIKKLAGHSNIMTTQLYIHSNLEQETRYLNMISC